MKTEDEVLALLLQMTKNMRLENMGLPYRVTYTPVPIDKEEAHE